MQRFLSLLISFATVALLFTATAGQASTYRVTLAQATDAHTMIIRDAAWRCSGTSCATNQARSRPIHVCISAARELGQLTDFTIDGEAIAAEELARCNADAQ